MDKIIWYVYTSELLAQHSLYYISNSRIKCYLYVCLYICIVFIIILITQQLMHVLIEIRHTNNAKSIRLRLEQLLITKQTLVPWFSLLNCAYKLAFSDYSLVLAIIMSLKFLIKQTVCQSLYQKVFNLFLLKHLSRQLAMYQVCREVIRQL